MRAKVFSSQYRANISAVKKGTPAPNRLAVKITNEEQGISFEASSLTHAAAYLTALGIKTSKTTVGRDLKEGKLREGWKVSLSGSSYSYATESRVET